MSEQHLSRKAQVISFVIVALAIVGYFVGLQAPMSPTHDTGRKATNETESNHLNAATDVTPATAYSDMAKVTNRDASSTSLTNLKSFIDPLAEIRIEPGEKQRALAARERNRAFNGAPPTIPHPINQRSADSCMACHGKGIKTTSLRVPQMSHAFLANCTQCHVESSSTQMEAFLFRMNHFVGLPAPESGPRAFAQAPPQIPHTTWMRSNCMSCHGETGLNGIRTTHPWRVNCQQCHAPSSELDQTFLVDKPVFLPRPNIKPKD